jgi:hypothetical protein
MALYEYDYIVTVKAGSRDEADQVMAERVYHDEDYGFEYRIDFERYEDA